MQEKSDTEVDRIIESLGQLRRFDGPPNEFWPAFLEGLARLAGARFGLLLIQGEDKGSWKNLCTWPPDGTGGFKASGIKLNIDEIAETSLKEGYAWESIETAGGTAAGGVVLGVCLDLEERGRAGVAVFLLDNETGIDAEEAVCRLKLVADTPAVYQLRRVVHQAKRDVLQFSEALDLMVLINEEKRYMAAAMTFCNELASRYRCGRVSLGWLKGKYIRLQAISHMERFDKKMDAVQGLEGAMEEAFDQDEEIMWPQPEDSSAVARDHEAFSREQGSKYIVSLPIRLDDAPVGVLTCERLEVPFSEDEIRGLRVLCDQAARRLGDLKQNDRWFGAKMSTSARKRLSRFLGVEHTFAKCMGLILCAALAILLFGQWDYRVEAPFILKTDDLAFLPAPFDGYIHAVHMEVGDQVNKGDLLLSLDTNELLLEESTAIANQNRYEREAEKARAENALADMMVALALAEQGKARLDLVRYHLSHAEIRAPFSGIVVEGEFKELLGAPVRKGDVLFKVARIEKMYPELEVDERDVHEVDPGATAEIAFVSLPKLKFPIRVERIDPVAVTKEGGNVFLVRGTFDGDVAGWWRPGMSGVSKINAGRRNILWIFTHRTIDFFRILLWW